MPPEGFVEATAVAALVHAADALSVTRTTVTTDAAEAVPYGVAVAFWPKPARLCCWRRTVMGAALPLSLPSPTSAHASPLLVAATGGDGTLWTVRQSAGGSLAGQSPPLWRPTWRATPPFAVDPLLPSTDAPPLPRHTVPLFYGACFLSLGVPCRPDGLVGAPSRLGADDDAAAGGGARPRGAPPLSLVCRLDAGATASTPAGGYEGSSTCGWRGRLARWWRYPGGGWGGNGCAGRLDGGPAVGGVGVARWAETRPLCVRTCAPFIHPLLSFHRTPSCATARGGGGGRRHE